MEENQAGGYPKCRGCKDLRKKMWPYRRDLFNYLNLCHDISCNLLCNFCIVIEDCSVVSAPTDEVLRVIRMLIDSNYLSRNTSVVIGGGEPAMMRGLEKVLDFVNKSEYQVLICTNGTIFSEAIGNSLRTGKTTIIVSADAVSRDIYKIIKGKDFCHHVWENIKKYAEIDGTKVIPKMIIMEENAGEIEDFVQRCIESGVKSIIFDYNQKTTPNQKIIDAMKRFEKYCDDHNILGIPAHPNLEET